MTAYKGLGTYGNAVGVVTPLDHKLSNAAGLVKTTTPLVIRPGVLYSGTASLVSGTAGMSYSVAAYEIATQRSASAGVVFGGNDGTLSVATTAAPGSNSRIDVIYHWHREYSLDGVDSNPVIGVIQGTAAAVPTTPSLAAFPGAIEIGRATVSAGATATNAGGVVITQTAPFTSVDGSPIPFRNTTEMNLFTTALTYAQARDLSTGTLYTWNGSAWGPSNGRVVPSASSGSIAADGLVSFSAASSVSVDVAAFPDDEYEFIIDVTATSATTVPTVRLRASSADISTASYAVTSLYGSTSVAASSSPAGQTSWQPGLTGTLHLGKLEINGLGSARPKIGFSRWYATQNPQTAGSLYFGGLEFYASTVITGISFIFTGGTATGTLRIRRKNV